MELDDISEKGGRMSLRVAAKAVPCPFPIEPWSKLLISLHRAYVGS